MDFAAELDLLIRARYPLLYLVSTEEERAEQAIAEIASRPVYCWDFVEGFQQEGMDAGAARSNPLAALEFIERSRPDAQAIYILRDFHRFLEDIAVGRKLRNLARRLRSQPKTVILLAPRLAIPPDLAEEITVLEFPLPDSKAIEKEIETLLGSRAPKGFSREELVKACQGLALNRVRQALAKAVARSGGLDSSDVELILEEKKQKIRQTQILEFYPATETITDIGGLDALKEWLLRRGAAFSDQARRYGLPHPRGLLLVGVQGTGKSLTARAIAHHWHLPLLRLDVGRLFAGLVGESEARTRQMIQIAEALAPCVLFADEIDKTFGNLTAGGDSGTSGRVFATFLTWMAEKTSPVFVVATANDVHRLPPELLRKGRFDEIFFVNLPTQAERAEIFGVHLGKLRPHNLRAYDIDRLAYETPDFSGAEIEQVIVEAMHTGFAQGRDFTTDDILQAVAQIVPLARTAREQIEALQQWAAAGKARMASRQAGILSSLQRRLESTEE